MKKFSKNVLFIVIGILVAFTIDVAAEAVISSGAVSYSNTTVSTALDELFSAVDINKKIGTTDISTIGDGTITGVLNNIIAIDSLITRYSVSTVNTVESVDCSWSDYYLLLIVFNHYGNFWDTQIVPTSYFKDTSSSNRVQMSLQDVVSIQIYQNGTDSINIEMSNYYPYGVSVYGLMKK